MKRQKFTKSRSVEGSVATICTTSPAAISRTRLRTIINGSGHSSPTASTQQSNSGTSVANAHQPASKDGSRYYQMAVDVERNSQVQCTLHTTILQCAKLRAMLNTTARLSCDEAIMRNITLSADADTIDAARQRAESEHTTLNAEFRKWLDRYARRHQATRAINSVRELRAKYATGGRKFTRDEMNER